MQFFSRKRILQISDLIIGELLRSFYLSQELLITSLDFTHHLPYPKSSGTRITES